MKYHREATVAEIRAALDKLPDDYTVWSPDYFTIRNGDTWEPYEIDHERKRVYL